MMLGKQDEQSLRLKKSATQLLRMIRFCGYFMLCLALVYFSHSLYCLLSIDVKDFHRYSQDVAYAYEMYWYSVYMERMKVVYAFAMLMISVLVTRITARGHLLSDRHYKQMLIISLTATFLFILPFVYLVWMSYSDMYGSVDGSLMKKHSVLGGYFQDNKHMTALLKFADWMLMMALRTDMGWVGLSLTIFVNS